ncbi:class I SAM-dependent methyltransferase [Cobetia sp. L2A1]|uniref:class I SAM-dependent methyltransferase n=1 Tax=Cobetia sp. L2A1 TaxID=2686360 RepID=UPI00131CB1E7|nr:class I SAM-dependent methyltransferase [Cobetia sp. L2A1]
MRYYIEGNEVRAENTAKPYTQKSSAVNDYLKIIVDDPSVLDFGCGKLRYSDTLVKISSRVTFVDSEVQLNRTQAVRGELTSVKKYVEDNYDGCCSIAYENLAKHDEKYKLIICTNVLSAIPCKNTLDDIVVHMHRLLMQNGRVIIVNQYRSSYFKKYESGVKWLYGYLHRGLRGVTYYGVVDKIQVEALLGKYNFVKIRSWYVGESLFTEARVALV